MSRYGWLHEKKPYPADGEEHARCARADASEAVSESPVEQVLPNKGNEAETHGSCQHVEHSSHVVHIQLAAHYLVLLIVADPSQPLSLQLLHLTWGETHTSRPTSSISSVYNFMYTSVGRSTTVHRYILLFQISARTNMSKWGSVKWYTQALAICWHHLRLFSLSLQGAAARWIILSFFMLGIQHYCEAQRIVWREREKYCRHKWRKIPELKICKIISQMYIAAWIQHILVLALIHCIKSI